VGDTQTDDDLPALDKEQLDSLLDENSELPADDLPIDESTVSPLEEDEMEEPEHINPAYISWLNPSDSSENVYGQSSNANREESQRVSEENHSPFEQDKRRERDKSTPFERLYSTNPELFETMTVGEFVPHARELRRLEDATQKVIDSIEEVAVNMAKLEAHRQQLLRQADEREHEVETFLDRYKSQIPEESNTEEAS
jgi:hypothetical protein